MTRHGIWVCISSVAEAVYEVVWMAGGEVGWRAKTDSWIFLSYRHNRGIRNAEISTMHMLDAKWLKNTRETGL